MTNNNTDKKITAMEDKRVLFSTLWIFVTANYIFCDVLSIMEPGFFKVVLTEVIASDEMSQEFLLGAAILMEIPFAMILLSRVLKYRANRWANIIAGTIMTAVQVGTLFMGTSTQHYIFYSIIEIACDVFIVWFAWTWRNPEGSPNNNI